MSQPFTLPNVWGSSRNTKGMRTHNRNRLVTCDICGEETANTKKHRATCLAPGPTKIPRDHKLCGVDGCDRMRPGSARTCYLHETIDDHAVETFDRLDRLTGTGKYKGRTEANA